MRLRQIALTGSLLLVLVGCGSQSPVTPTPNPAPPPTQPTEPAPPAQPDTPPGQGVQYYGEWGWTFQGEESYEAREGRYSMLEPAEEGSSDSVGLYQICYDTCYDNPDGYAYMGLDGEGKLSVQFFRLSSTEELVRLYGAVDADGVLTEDDRGRLTFEGEGTAYEEFIDVTSGNFRAVFLNATPALAFTP